MKNLLTLLFITLSIVGFSGETILLSLDNPSPRVGDKIKLSFNIDPLENELENQLANGIDLYKVNNLFKNMYPALKKVIIFNTTGEHTVGPFKFEINGTTYLTDSIVVTVMEKLPFEPGLWIRTTQMNGKNYLIIEQYIENNEKIKTKKNSTTYTTEKKSEFVKLNRESEEFSIGSSNTSSTNKKEDESDFMSTSMSFSFSQYEIKLNQSYEGEFVFDKTHFENLPKRYKIEGLIIKN